MNGAHFLIFEDFFLQFLWYISRMIVDSRDTWTHEMHSEVSVSNRHLQVSNPHRFSTLFYDWFCPGPRLSLS